jgi:hypothetical protein
MVTHELSLGVHPGCPDPVHDWPSHHAVAFMPGSLPLGGVVPMTPIHAFDSPPQALSLQLQPGLHPARHDISLGGLLAFVITEVLSTDEADALVAATERLGYRDEAPGIATPPGMRMNKSVHWVADEAWTGALFQRIAHLLPERLDGQALYPRFSQRLNMYRYDANDVFNRHTDGNWPGYGLSDDRQSMVEWAPGLRSGLTMLLYLNGPADGVQGGSTRLFSRDGRFVDVEPVKGSALFFRHGFGLDSVVHEGRRVLGQVAKYVARINVMYCAD